VSVKAQLLNWVLNKDESLASSSGRSIPEKLPLVPLNRRFDGAHDYIWTFQKREKSFLPLGY
jgi:hypothetical protein